MIHQRKTLHSAVFVTTVCAVLLIAGCGRRSSSNPTTPATTTPATTTPATTANSTAPTVTMPTTIAPATTASPTTTTQDPAKAKAEITANWERFFLPTTAIADRVALLENGPALQQALELRATDPLQAQASAVVKSVELTAPDQATVTYDVLLNGVVALPDSQGISVRRDGVWKVGAESFCALISLGATGPIPGCG
ncbi:unannotated protein [freshwater metagenome]|uniref:Unannotated protein n=1 Tax=freshwater metagenome TaxID=449393 RepID=A0A6J7DGV7_9ZZZZ|nr:hypothetical protein [Actinomycetota bacterium]